MPRQLQHIRENFSGIKLIYKLIDSASIGLGLVFLLQWWPLLNSDATIVSFLVALGLFSITAEFMGLYRNWQGIHIEREVTCGLATWIFTLSALLVLGSMSLYTTELSTHALLGWFGMTATFSLSGRVGLRWMLTYLIKLGIYTRSFAVIGINELGIQLVRNVQSSPELGLRFVGFYDDRPKTRTSQLPEDLPGLGRIEDLVQRAKNNEVSVIFITLPMRGEERIRQVISDLSDSTTSVYIVPDLFVFQLLHSRWTDIQGVPVVSVFENPFYGVDGMLKRISDIILASAAIALAALPMILIGLSVKLTSRGPMFFRQRRYGLDGREFFVWKFRSMSVCEDGETIEQARYDDSRLTSIGAFLRRTSLDELPQLFNVLVGSMSLVGPRPHASAHNELYRSQIEGYMLRHKVKPGITGLAQVNGCRGETQTLDKMEQRIQFDHRYIREWSIWLDLRILWQTLFVVLSRQNAH